MKAIWKLFFQLVQTCVQEEARNPEVHSNERERIPSEYQLLTFKLENKLACELLDEGLRILGKQQKDLEAKILTLLNEHISA